MNLNLKLALMRDLENRDLIDVIDDGNVCLCKITTNNLSIEMDNRDARMIKALKNVKIIISVEEGCIILFGNLGCSFVQPFGGEFWVRKVILDNGCDFDNTIGVDADITFTNFPTDIDTMKNMLGIIAAEKNFRFNITQFEDFMDIFGYYKQLSDELNNSASYKINSVSKPYLFMPVTEKGLYGLDGELLDDYRSLEEILDSNGIIKGYKIEEYTFELMSNKLRESVEELVDLKIAKTSQNYKKIRKMINDLYTSNFSEINQKNARNLKALSCVNSYIEKDVIVLSVEFDENHEYNYLNLYDMGQKVKVDSIEESLRLIKQGNSGSAIQLLSYLIGENKMPNSKIRDNATIRKYTKNLNDSQKNAFLKAIDDSPVTLIKGPPGTGKTHVINAITQYITKELEEKVVISSQTHVAIDNVLDKLMENYDLVVPNRITNRKNRYSGDAIDYTLYKTWGKKLSQHISKTSNKSLAKNILKEMNNFSGEMRFKFSEDTIESNYFVLGATTTTSAIAGKKGLELLKEYKWLIIDEVSKCPITEVLRYLPYIEKIIMVGDDFQLAPLLEFKKEQVKDLPSYDEDKFEKLERVYEKSVFADTIEKAKEADRLVELDINYRSLPNVLRAYNIFYNNNLKSMRLDVEPPKVEFNEKMDYIDKNDATFVYVRGGKEVSDSNSTSRYNIEELIATRDILIDIMDNVKNPSTLTVSAIFPYADQISKFTKMNRDLINKARKLFRSFEVDTVDAFQGKESDIVLVNTVVTDLSKKNFLTDFRRINVAMSRAKDKLIVFGNPQVLSRLDMTVNNGAKRKYFKEIIDDIRRFGIIVDYTSEGGISIGATSKTKTKIKKTTK